MGALSTFAVNGLQDLTFRGDPFDSPTDVYLSWFTTPPGPDGGTEPTGGGFAREVITFDPPSDGNITQAAPVEWTVFHSTTDQMVSGWGIFDAVTDGNLLAYGRTPSRVIRAGATLVAPEASITVSSNDAHHTDYLANAWLGHLLAADAYTAPSSIHLGVYTETPTATTAGTEVGDRQVVDFDTAADMQSLINSVSTWAPLDDTDLHVLDGWAISDDDTAGNVLVFASWPEPVVVPALDTLELAAGWLTLRAQ